MNHRFHAGVDRRGTTQVSAAFAGNSLRKVASPAAAVHRFALGRKAKTLFRAFMGLNLALAFTLAHHSRRSKFR